MPAGVTAAAWARADCRRRAGRHDEGSSGRAEQAERKNDEGGAMARRRLCEKGENRTDRYRGGSKPIPMSGRTVKK